MVTRKNHMLRLFIIWCKREVYSHGFIWPISSIARVTKPNNCAIICSLVVWSYAGTCTPVCKLYQLYDPFLLCSFAVAFQKVGKVGKNTVQMNICLPHLPSPFLRPAENTPNALNVSDAWSHPVSSWLWVSDFVPNRTMVFYSSYHSKVTLDSSTK